MKLSFSFAATILAALPLYASSQDLEELFAQIPQKQIELTSPDGLTVQISSWTPSWNRGYLHQLNGGGEDALGRIPEGMPVEVFAQDFLDQMAEFWGISDKTAFELDQIEDLTSPYGHRVREVHFSQFYDGQPVFDGDFQAIFWDDRLVQVAGQAFVPGGRYVKETVFDTEAAISAVQALGETQDLVIFQQGVSAEWNRAVVVVQGYLINPDTQTPQPYRFFVDAHSNEILWADLEERNYPSYTGTYRIYKPTSSSTTPNVANQVDVTNGYISVDGSQVYPWQDVLTNRSPVPVYDATMYWTSCQGNSPCLGFHKNSNGVTTFIDSPASSYLGDNFRSQHASYWVQRAVRAGDINFNWWPPSSSNYKYSRIVTVVNENNPNQVPHTGNNGCWQHVLWRTSDDVRNSNPLIACINLPLGAAYLTDPGKATHLNAIFHEVGHAIDHKYNAGSFRGASISDACDPNTSEEANSMSETVASLYAIMMMFHEFGASTSFTQSSITDLTNLQGSGNLDAHTNDSNLKCHADPNLSCKNNPYEYGHSLLQAYFEINHGINCDGPVGDPCYVMPDTARTDEARWALFYAMKNTPKAGTYRAFVSNLLDYYYNDVGQTAGDNRWWVFNHHGLVGPDYSYTPCSED